MTGSTVDDSTVLEQSVGVQTIDLGDQCVLIDTLRNESLSLNSSGADVWRLIERGPTFGALLKLISAEWSIPKDRCREELDLFVSKLIGLSLVGGNAVRVTKGTEKS